MMYNLICYLMHKSDPINDMANLSRSLSSFWHTVNFTRLTEKKYIKCFITLVVFHESSRNLYHLRSVVLARMCANLKAVGYILQKLLTIFTFYHQLISCQHMAEKAVQIP